MSIKSQKDFFAGLVFMGAGGAFAWGATGYRVGSAVNMGPGYLPLVLGSLLALLGLLMVVKALWVKAQAGHAVGAWAWRPLFSIVAANLAFGLLLGGWPAFNLPAMGLVVAIYALVLVAGLGAADFRLKERVWLASVLALLSYLVFVLLLDVQFAVWPAFMAA